MYYYRKSGQSGCPPTGRSFASQMFIFTPAMSGGCPGTVPLPLVQVLYEGHVVVDVVHIKVKCFNVWPMQLQECLQSAASTRRWVRYECPVFIPVLDSQPAMIAMSLSSRCSSILSRMKSSCSSYETGGLVFAAAGSAEKVVSPQKIALYQLKRVRVFMSYLVHS